MDEWDLPPELFRNTIESTNNEGPVIPILLFIVAGMLIYLVLMMFLASERTKDIPESAKAPESVVVDEDGSSRLTDQEEIHQCYV